MFYGTRTERVIVGALICFYLSCNSCCALTFEGKLRPLHCSETQCLLQHIADLSFNI